VYPFILIIQSAGLLPVNNHPEDTPPNPLNTTFDYISDEKEFVHQRLTQLQLPEIEQFVKDWYQVRIDNKRERDANVNDLIRILRDEDHIAIRELAQNPLLLTIVALVHRIDAVLPDERVVLYQKCTETLLNTWHTWKFRDVEVKNRGKIERRNRRRMEAIAYWMHCLSEGTEINQRAVVPYADLRNFLTEHINTTEKIRDHDSDPEDLAYEFLEFVKKRAGLLIEIGDNQYSFVHLTFQEYLTASHIITSSEMSGVSKIWETLDYWVVYCLMELTLRNFARKKSLDICLIQQAWQQLSSN
jgi:hypothetical protein